MALTLILNKFKSYFYYCCCPIINPSPNTFTSSSSTLTTHDGFATPTPNIVCKKSKILIIVDVMDVLNIPMSNDDLDSDDDVHKVSNVPDNNMSCSICLLSYQNCNEFLHHDDVSFENQIEKVYLLPCHHQFHCKCLDIWIEKEHVIPTCPLCRSPIPIHHQDSI